MNERLNVKFALFLFAAKRIVPLVPNVKSFAYRRIRRNKLCTPGNVWLDLNPATIKLGTITCFWVGVFLCSATLPNPLFLAATGGSHRESPHDCGGGCWRGLDRFIARAEGLWCTGVAALGGGVPRAAAVAGRSSRPHGR